jgi:hypothetical protein
MKLIEFLNKKELQVPTSYTGDFVSHVKDLLVTKFLHNFRDSMSEIEPNQLFKPIDEIIQIQEELVHGLIDTIEMYLNGHPFNAYQKFASVISRVPGMNYLTRLYGRHDFYRMRIKKEGENFEEKDLFHIPFHKRELIKPQRFSIAGFPCLYLGKSLYSCWVELPQRPRVEDVYLVRLHEARGLKYFDLRWAPNAPPETETVYHYVNLMRWPLIAATSIKVKLPNFFFKPEHIIPQLLLQWIRNNKTFDGIIYNSTHIPYEHANWHGWFSNLVIPVKESKHSGYCGVLSKSFKMSKPELGSDILKTEEYKIQSTCQRDIYEKLMVKIHNDEKNDNYEPYRTSLLCKVETYSLSRPLSNLLLP